jgi:5-methylcytosine-specific restriction enzyme A
MRNPPWTRDELILAFDLYLKKGHSPSPSEVTNLSNLLRSLPIHKSIPDEIRFRNENGVSTKLANIAAGDPSYKGKGLDRGNSIEKDIWQELAQPHGKEKLSETANAIRFSADSKTLEGLEKEEEGEESCPEGKVLYRIHRVRERNPKIVKKKKKSVLLKTGKLECEICSFVFKEKYGSHGEDYIECHHKVPLSKANNSSTRLNDLALVCANCHRMLHRGKPWPSVEQLKDMLNP